MDNGAGEDRHNLHVGSGACCSEAGGTASPGDVELGSQCWEVLTYSKDPPGDHPQCLGMSLAEALCLGCWLQSLPGESHTPETREVQIYPEDQPNFGLTVTTGNTSHA